MYFSHASFSADDYEMYVNEHKIVIKGLKTCKNTTVSHKDDVLQAVHLALSVFEKNTFKCLQVFPIYPHISFR